MGQRRYVDVNVFVYWLGGHPRYGERAKKWVFEVENSGRRVYYTSALTLYETLVILGGLLGGRLRDRGFVEKVLTAFRELESLEIVPLEKRIVLDALVYMEEYGLDYEDAVHLASALSAGAGEIVSNDGDFDRGPLNRVF
ncbi:MAG: type II toxin-antitoxin system VapC family toxin [Desulfurococcales archaeon]|nr:type II toxin-antitoxin system VapC family toxin [Desulfurococcales archaeon]